MSNNTEGIFLDYGNVTVVIPSLDPDEKLINLVNELHDNGFDDIVVVNDGSSAERLKYFPDPQKLTFCTVLTHYRNRGKGAALKTAFKFFCENRKGKDGLVTIDADGQHLTNDVKKCVDLMLETGKVVLGCRDFSKPDVPFKSRYGNRTTSLVFKLFCGLKISDTQTGLRAIPERFVADICEVGGSRYEYETNMLLEFKKRHIDFTETTIDTVYLDGNKESHFRPFADSLRIYKLILSFVFSSLLSMLVELVIFYLTLEFFFKGKYDVLLATVVARVISSVVNFTVNRKKVFAAEEKLGRTLIRYIILAIPLAVASMGSIKAFSVLLSAQSPILKTLLKMVVDTILFFVSFRAQQNWVFAPKTAPKKDKTDVKEKKKLTVGKVILRTLASLGTSVLCLVVALVTLLAVVARGPSTTLRDALVLSAMQASATKWVPRIFLSKETVDGIVASSYVDSKLIIDIDSYNGEDGKVPESDDEYIDGMKYISEKHDNFRAYILLIKDPKKVYVGTSSDNFSTATQGMRIFELVKKDNCIAAMNGGEFRDDGGMGTGAAPMGLTYSDGECVWNDGVRRTFMGIDKNDRLVVSESMTKEKADSLGVRDGVSFKTGNLLIDNDDSGVHIYYKQGNTGAAQRSAIGQRADGTFIFLVTDGRSASSIGATYNEVIDIMVSYGAVSAGMLDGGSSSMLYYEDYYNKYDVDKSELDEYQLQGLTNKYKAFTPPRRIPTYFCVSR